VYALWRVTETSAISFPRYYCTGHIKIIMYGVRQRKPALAYWSPVGFILGFDGGGYIWEPITCIRSVEDARKREGEMLNIDWVGRYLRTPPYGSIHF